MQTHFTLAQLADPDVAEADSILRKCVHCGFCTATCPTYVLLGDELDSPRGRIYLIKQMLESGAPANATVVRHVDRCLSCLSCMTTCPSGVHYLHLVDHARAHIEATWRRPPAQRWLRALLAWMLPRPAVFRLALLGARLARPVARWLPDRGTGLGAQLRAMFGLLPSTLATPSPVDRPQVFPAEGHRRARVALLTGCAQTVLAPEINEATVRLLTRHGCEVVVAPGAGCCGALAHHMGKVETSHAQAAANVDAWMRVRDIGGLDAVVINTSGCGTTVKDYGHMLREDRGRAAAAAEIAGITRDISELLAELGLGPVLAGPGASGGAATAPLAVAYHAACSLQHGQKVTKAPKSLLTAAGFTVREVPEAHLCCGSAGTYNLLQPEIAQALGARKRENIGRVTPDVVAAGNIGCITQIAAGMQVPVLHTVELLDWATGGPVPERLAPRLAGLGTPEQRRAAD